MGGPGSWTFTPEPRPAKNILPEPSDEKNITQRPGTKKGTRVQNGKVIQEGHGKIKQKTAGRRRSLGPSVP